MPETPGPHLAIRRDDLRQFLPGLARLGGKSSRDEAVIGFADGEMWVRAGGMEVAVPARGYWPGEAVIPHAAFKALSRLLPDADPVRVIVTENRLMLGGLTVPCRWSPTGSALVTLAMNADLRDLLLADLMHSEETLAASAVLKRVEDARAMRDKLLDRAAKQLVPLGISRDHLDRLLHEILLERL